jgi:DNA replication protein DnaC
MKRLSDMQVPPVRPGIKAKGSDCLICQDTGWKPVDKGVVRCPDCWERRRGFAPGVPDAEAKTSLDTYGTGDYQVTEANKAAIQHARFFVDDVHPSLYLYGGIGSGKTALACAILNDLHRKGRQVKFVRVTDLLKQLVQPDTGDQLYGKLIDVPVLCLDDIGAQKAGAYAWQTILAISDGRGDRNKRTIWTSNLSLDGLAEFFGDERLASRIAGVAKVVQLDGIDYRLRRARRRKP